MPRKPYHNFDLCPVCRESGAKRGSIYCSEECLNDAKRYRRRLDNIVGLFRKAGFCAKFVNGVQLEMTMPLSIRDCYPKASWTFTFPEFFANIATFRQSDLTGAMKHWLGEKIYELTIETVECGHGIAAHIEVSATLTPVLSATIPVESFICNRCLRPFVKSADTFSEEDGLCRTCHIEEIPF